MSRAEEIVQKIIKNHYHVELEFGSEVERELAAALGSYTAERVKEEQERCAKALEAVTQVREAAIFRGLNPAEEKDGWRPLSASEKALLRSCIARIREGGEPKE